MEKIEIKDLAHNKPHMELANDVAMLFSWAKMENTPYRDFSRPRKTPSAPVIEEAVIEVSVKSEAVGWPAQVTSSIPAVVFPESDIPQEITAPSSAQAAFPAQSPPVTRPSSGRIAPVAAARPRTTASN